MPRRRQVSADAVVNYLSEAEKPFATTTDIAEELDVTAQTVRNNASRLTSDPRIKKGAVGQSSVYWAVDRDGPAAEGRHSSESALTDAPVENKIEDRNPAAGKESTGQPAAERPGPIESIFKVVTSVSVAVGLWSLWGAIMMGGLVLAVSSAPTMFVTASVLSGVLTTACFLTAGTSIGAIRSGVIEGIDRRFNGAQEAP